MKESFSDSQLREVLYSLLGGRAPRKLEVFMADMKRQIDAHPDVRTAVAEVLAHPMTFTEGTCLGEPEDTSSAQPIADLQKLLDASSSYDWINGDCDLPDSNA